MATAKNLTVTPQHLQSNAMKQKREELKKKLEYDRDRDQQMIRGVFNYLERKGGKLEFSFLKYKGDQIEKYVLQDGHEYTLPLAVVNHLNKNCSYPIHTHATDENGVPYVRIGQIVRRCSFSNYDFMMEDLMPEEKSLVTIEHLK